MAIKSSDQITIVDLTDAYSIMLSSDAVALKGTTNKLGTAQNITVNVSAFRGNEQLTPAVGTPTCPTNVSATVGSASGNIVPVTITFGANLAASGKVVIPVSVDEITIDKELSFAIAFTGAGGAAAYNVLCGNESQVIYCDKDGNVSGEQTITIPFAGYQGTGRVACTLTDPTLPTGFTKTSNAASTTSADGSYVCKVADGTSLAATGTITLSFKISSTTFTKRFTYTRAQVGATGQQGPQGNPGTNGTSATSVVCGNEAVTIACDKDGKAAAASSIVIPFAGYIGTTRAACTVAYSTLPSGVTLASNGNKAATASADGSLTLSVAKSATFGNAATMTGEITLTFTCNSQTFVKKFTWSKALTGATGARGPQGDAGEDAITLVIISSAGTIFKNTAIATTLTAHVYKAGAEVTGDALTALGTINWYKDGGSTAVATGQSLSISAGDVTNKASYEARLEA